MRIAIMAAAFGLVIGAPVLAPTNFMNVAVAQTAAETALEAELIAAAGDPDALAAIISREQAAGNTDGLATALANASITLAATDIAGAAALVIQAVEVGEGASDDVQEDVGDAASRIATTAMDNGDANTANDVETAVALTDDADTQMAYVDSGGQAGNGVQQQGGDDDNDQQGGNQQGGNQQGGGDDDGDDDDNDDDSNQQGSNLPEGAQQGGNQPGTGNNTPPPPPGNIGGPPPRPPVTNVVIPVPIEPNPGQSGSPT